MEGSVVNRRWMEELKKYPEDFEIHQLYKAYPDEKINVLAEQRLMENFEKVVFQFPVYWYSSPPLLKKWFDEVLIYGWAFGSKSGYRLENKKISIAVSLGSGKDEYTLEGHYGHTIDDLLVPFKLTFNYVKADYRPFFASYGLDLHTSNNRIEESVQNYLDFLKSF